MAIIKKGINGPISGKIGNIVGSSWNGIEYLKSLPKRTKPYTEGELKNQFIFKLSQKWLQPLLPFVRVGFKDYSATSKGFNAAKSHLSKNALVKDGFDSYIDPSLALVSHGELPLPGSIGFEKTDPMELTFTWDPSTVPGSDPNDQIMMLAYNVKAAGITNSGNAEFVLNGQFRRTGRDTLFIEAPTNLADLTYHIYAAFVAADRESQSNSVYLGTVEFLKQVPQATQST